MTQVPENTENPVPGADLRPVRRRLAELMAKTATIHAATSMWSRRGQPSDRTLAKAEAAIVELDAEIAALPGPADGHKVRGDLSWAHDNLCQLRDTLTQDVSTLASLR